MDKIWIRTQDRERLLLCNNFHVSLCCIKKEYDGRKYSIETNNAITLGIYRDKTRALEVLDAIMLTEANLFCMPED